MTNPFLWLTSALIWTYIYFLIAAAVMSWLIAFNVVNSQNPTVRMVWNFLYQVTEPALRPIRGILPNLGGIDISPIILILGLMFLEKLIYWLYLQLFV
jgi:YggT family protein